MYYPHGVNLSENQLKTLRLTPYNLTGNHQLLVTQQQIKVLLRAQRNCTGSDIKISRTQPAEIDVFVLLIKYVLVKARVFSLKFSFLVKALVLSLI